MAAAARLRSPASNITVKTGFTACAETGAMNDQTVTAPGLRRLAERERFLAFAFTAADILLEVDAERRIVFAAGAAVKFRLGVPAEALLGRGAETLVAAADRPGFIAAFDALLARGRIAPSRFRLADPQATPIALAGLRLPQPEGVTFTLTISALPAELPARAATPDTGRSDTGRSDTGQSDTGRPEGGLAQTAESRLREARDGTLLLLELKGEDGPITPRRELAARLQDALRGGNGDRLVSELASGRYGVLSDNASDLAAIGARLEAVLAKAGLPGTVAGSSLALCTEGLSSLQATRALRYALTSFAAGGSAALEEEGFSGGLAGFVAQACGRAEALRRAIADHRFRLAFQPIVRLSDRSLHHYEALLRPIPTQDVALAHAQEFVVFAETVGLSEELDWAVMESVCSAARNAGDVRIACNLSGLSVQSSAFRERLLKRLDAEPALVPRLLVEITETAEIEQEAEAIATVEALRARAIPICIDDFGAGAAAFRYLRTFRVDYVKIDGLYVENARRGAQDRGFLSSMVDLARNVGAQVVAERIETEEDAAAMLELGIGFGQGWLFGRPGRLPDRG